MGTPSSGSGRRSSKSASLAHTEARGLCRQRGWYGAAAALPKNEGPRTATGDELAALLGAMRSSSKDKEAIGLHGPTPDSFPAATWPMTHDHTTLRLTPGCKLTPEPGQVGFEDLSPLDLFVLDFYFFRPQTQKGGF